MVASTLGRLTTRGIALRIFFTCWLIFALHFATNTVREIYPALSLGDHFSFDVSEYFGLHPDIIELPNGGVFINNNPGASILAAVPYTLSRPVIDLVTDRVLGAREASGATMPEYDSIYPMAQEFFRQAFERGLDVKFGLAAGVMQVFLMAPLSALAAVVMFYIMLSLAQSATKATALALLFALATPVFYRTAQLNHNLLQAHFALFSFFLLWRPWDDPLRPKRPYYFPAGLLAGWTLVLDYSGIIIIGAIAFYATIRRRSLPEEARTRGDLVEFAAGVLMSAAVLVAYQWLAFGHPLYPAQHYMPETTFSGRGYQGMDLPQLDLLWENAFGIRYGLFISAPILILALYVPGWLRERNRLLGMRETLFVVIITLSFFLFTAANQFSRMQFNSGVRHMVPVTPFVFLLAATVLLQFPRRPATLVGVFAVFWSWTLAMYRDVEQGLGILESPIHILTEGPRLPWLATLEGMGYVSTVLTIPLLLISLVLIGALWRFNGWPKVTNFKITKANQVKGD